MSYPFKVTVMGKEVPFDELPEPVPTADTFFAKVRVPPHMLDMASKIVPREVWAADGIYTWLNRRANEVFKTVPVGQWEAVHGRLKWVFAHEADVPYLKSLIIQSAAK